MRIGVDLGGTKIEVIGLGDDGTVAWRRRCATPPGDYDGILDAIVRLIAELEAELGETAPVGVGTPGTVSALTGAMKNCNSTCLNDQCFREDLSSRLGRPVRVANDANCFALSEATDGAGAGKEVVFGVILGTGVGGGIVVDGMRLSGVNGIAGEWGHNPLPFVRGEDRTPRPCYCGRSDCVETWLSGPAFERSYTGFGGNPLGAKEIAARAATGTDPVALATLEQYVADLARALATVINIVDPDVIVLGGGMANIAALYEQVPAAWACSVFSDRVATRLLPARFGDSSGVRGAAWLWPPDSKGQGASE